MSRHGKADFDLEVVLEGITKCRQENDELLTEHYLRGYRELCRFFKLMGKIFAFVAYDIESKIEILEHHVASENGSNYRTIQDMIQYEVRHNKTVVHGNPPSGSRTLLRLHRALQFIMSFMLKFSESSDDAKTSAIAQTVYKDTLAHHHIWIVRKMAAVAMYTLPRRQNLIEMMCKQDCNTVLKLAMQVADALKPVYDITQKIYEENELLSLP